MLGETLQSVLAWLAAHPHWVGLFLFSVAFIESLALIGFVMPGAVLLFASGAVLASGVYPLGDALLYATLGAILGDGLSYWLGRHYQQRLTGLWPFSRHPQLLEHGEQFFMRHGGKSVALGRFVGPIRAIVPAVAGMLGMSPLRFYIINILSAIAWAPAYILPGVVFGATLSLAADAAGRLVALLLLLACLMLLSLWLLRIGYQWAVPVGERRVAQFHRWLQQHPRWQYGLAGIVDPQLSAFKGLLLWGVFLFCCTAGFAWLLLAMQQSGPLSLDLHLWQFLQGQRSPLLDEWFVAITRLGDGRVSVPIMLLLMGWLWWRGSRILVGYLLATLLFALSVPLLLKVGLQLPRPGDYGEGWSRYGFPSWHAAMAMLLYGSLAIVVARELTEARRWWAYAVALVPIGLISFSRLYLGVHWLSDVLGGLALAGAWLTVLGIAYRRHVQSALAWRPLLLLVVLGGGLLWAVHLANSPDNSDYLPPSAALINSQGEQLARSERVLNLLWQGEAHAIQQQLLDEGWQAPAVQGWQTPLHWLMPPSSSTPPAVLPHYYVNGWDGIRMFRYQQGRWWVLRLWPSAMLSRPLQWRGEVVAIKYQTVLSLLYLPRSEQRMETDALQLLWPVGIMDGERWSLK